jgi:hypothetical protein
MSETNSAIRATVIDLWFHKDLSARQIEPLVPRKKTWISETIQEYRKSDPTIDELKGFYQMVKKNKINPRDLPRIVVFKGKLDGLNFATDSLPGCLKILASFPDNSEEAVAAGLLMIDLQAEEGKTFTELTTEFPILAANVKSLREKETSLTKTVEQLEKIVPEHERLLELSKKLKERGLSNYDTLDRWIDRQRKLDELDFTEQAADSLARELAANKTTPIESAKIVTGILVEHNSLSDAISVEKRNLNELDQQVNRARSTIKDYQTSIDSMKTTLSKLNVEAESQKEAIAESQSEIDFSRAFTSLAKDPRFLTNSQIDTLSSNLQEIKRARESGLTHLSDANAQTSKESLLQGLVDIVKLDVVRKSEFEQLSEKYEILSKQSRKDKSDLNENASELTKLRLEKESMVKVDAQRGLQDLVLLGVNDVLSGFQTNFGKIPVYCICPRCKGRRGPQRIDSTNFKASFNFTCKYCSEESHPSIQQLYLTTLKLTLGAESEPPRPKYALTEE